MTAASNFLVIAWQGWGVLISISALLILLTTILLWLLPFPRVVVERRFATPDGRLRFTQRFSAGQPLARYLYGAARFERWLDEWFGRPWSTQAFERCLAIAFVFPVALYMLAALITGFRQNRVTPVELLALGAGAIVFALFVRWLFMAIFWGVRGIWSRTGGDSETAVSIARLMLGAFAVVFAFAIAFAVASSLAGDFTDAGMVVFAILGGFAFAFGFAVAYAIAGIWAVVLAAVAVIVVVHATAELFAFYMLLFFILLPVVNALIDWVSWATTRAILARIAALPNRLGSAFIAGALLLLNLVAALALVALLAALLPNTLEIVSAISTLLGAGQLDWQGLARSSLALPWSEGLFVTGMLLAPLLAPLSHFTVALMTLLAPWTPGAGRAVHALDAGRIGDAGDIGLMKRTALRARWWALPAGAVVLGAAGATLWSLDGSVVRPGQTLKTIALCTTSWSHTTCPIVQ